MEHQGIDDIIEMAQDGRTTEALAALDLVLAEVNDEPRLHALRAFLLLEAGRFADAQRAAELAHALDDEDHLPLLALARVALAAGEPTEAIARARAAHALAPDDHEPVVIEARARALLGQWDEVIARAEYVLAEDPHNAEAAFLRIAALESRAKGSARLDPAEWDQLAERFPHIATARAGRAWTLLHRGRARQAEHEFRDALALDPSDPWAKEGLVLALKARYPGYTLLLRFFFWLQSLPPGTQTAVLIGGVLGTRVLRGVAQADPSLAPFITPVIWLYFGFVLLTWLADPLLNLALLTKAEGRRLIGGDERRGALAVGATLGVALLLGAIGLLAPWGAALGAAAAVGLTSLTTAAGFACAPGTQRRGLLIASGLLATLGVASLAFPGDTGALFVGVAVIGVVIGTWVSRPLIRRSHERHR